MRRSERLKSRQPAAAANQSPRLWNIRNAAGTAPVIELFGDIGMSKQGDPFWGMEGGAGTFQEFAAELKKIGNVPELIVEIHSYGGSVTVGKGIYDKLLEHPANKTARIYGICASAATYATLACQKVQIPANSFFLIHNSTGMCYGTAHDMEQAMDMLEIADESIANLYASRTGKTVEEIRDIMDRDTWMSGADAVALGLADEVIEPLAIDPTKRVTPENFRPAIAAIPQNARDWFDMSRLQNAQPVPPPHSMQPAPSAPINAAPPTTAPAVSAAPAPEPAAAPAPVNAAPDLATQITNAVTAAIAPLQAEVARLQGLQNHGITTLGGAQPVAAVATPPAANTMSFAAFNKLPHAERNAFMKNGGKLQD